MRFCTKFVITVGALALVASPALAQRGGGGFGGRGGGGIGTLLQNASVQKELKIDDDQKKDVTEAVQKVTDKYKDDFAKLADIDSKKEEAAKRAELTQTVSVQILKAVGEVLTKDQIKRLKEINLQNEGPAAFTRSDVVSALKLSDDQTGKIKDINADYTKQRREIMQAGGGGGRRGGGGGGGGGRGGANLEKLTALQKDTAEKIQGLLTADQKKSWKDMTGEPFTVTFGGGGRRGGGQQNQ